MIEETRAKVLAAIARVSLGESVNEICSSFNLARSTFHDYIANDSDLADKYARAKIASADRDLERLDDISRRVERGELDPQNARAAADITKWTMAKKAPKVYGDVTRTELTGSDGGPVQMQAVEWVIQPVKPVNQD